MSRKSVLPPRLKRGAAPALLLAALFGAPAVALHPAQALAQADNRSGNADEAEVQFRLGNEAYLAKQFERALSHYFASNRLAYNHNVIFNIARCFENLGRFVEAYRYYQIYLDGIREEGARRDIERAMSAIASKVGILRVESNPPGATVFLNRKDLGSYGTTPVSIPVKPGTYRVIVEREGWEGAESPAVEIRAGESAPQTLEMRRREGTVRLSGQPSSLQVQVDGEDKEPRSVALPVDLRIPAGGRTLSLGAPGYVPQRIPVEVVEGRNVEANVSLVAQTGTVVVTASEASSAVYLDGVLAGFTPAVITGVRVGEHVLTVRQDGYVPFTRTLRMEADARMEVSAELDAVAEVAAASRVAESVRDAPASVSLISAREIEAFAYSGTVDALSGTRGVFFTNDLSYRIIGLRGYGPFGQWGNRALVQLDGHTINDNWVEASYQEFELMNDLYGLERIELVRGPNSVLYGSGAFQGVINLVSPSPEDRSRTSRVGFSAVSDGVARAYTHLRLPWENGGLHLSAGLTGAQGRDYFSPARVGSADHPTGIAQEMGEFDAHTVRANAKLGNWRLYSYWHQRDQQVPTANFEMVFGDKDGTLVESRGYLDLRYEHAPSESDWAFHSRAYYDYYKFLGNYVYTEEQGGDLEDRFRSHWAGADARVDWRPTPGTRLSLGAEFVRSFIHEDRNSQESLSEPRFINAPFSKTSSHFIARQQLGSRMALWAGARYDLWLYDQLPDAQGNLQARQVSNINPRAVLVIRPVDSGTLKLMGGRGFRAASVYELTYNDGGVSQVANPNIAPETLYSGELEYTQLLPAGFELVGAVFTNRMSNRIEQEKTGEDGEGPLQYDNIQELLWTGGGELELRRPFLKGWMASAQYSWQRTRTGDFGNLLGSTGKISNSPTHLASAKLVMPLVERAVLLANRLTYESTRLDREGQTTNAVLLWDAVFSGQIPALPFRYAAGVRNLLDWRYAHPVGGDILDVTVGQPGRTFMVDVSTTF